MYVCMCVCVCVCVCVRARAKSSSGKTAAHFSRYDFWQELITRSLQLP